MKLGNSLAVHEFLQSVSRNEIPSSLVLRVAQLSRRMDHATKGLLLLRDRVLDLPSTQIADPRELCEYAACLIKVGAYAEALRLLEKINVENAPEASKFMGFACIHQWDYSSAILHLTKYLQTLDPLSYEHLVASLNLAASLVVTEQLAEAKSALQSIRERAELGNHNLVLGNTYELLAQTEIQQGHFEEAEHLLSKALESLKAAPTRYQLYIEKWTAVISLYRQEPNAISLLQEVRRKAISTHEWEVIRDCDFYQSIITRNSEMFLRLYFGTPHSEYRSRMLQKAKGQFGIPESFLLGQSDRVFDVSKGTLDETSVLKKGQALHKIATALLLDFYAPASVAQLFARVFESEQFHPESSPHRIQELVRRLREKFKEANVPLEIISLERGYKLQFENQTHIALRVSAERDVGLDLMAIIETHFGTEQFKLRDLMNFAGVPHTTLYRQIKDYIESGKILSFGSAKTTRYQLAPSAIKKVSSI